MPSITDAEKEIGRLTLALAEAEKKAERDYLRFVEADREEIERLREENARLRSLLGEVLAVWGVYYWPADIYRRAKAAIREGATDE